jgi:hypothetical protein
LRDDIRITVTQFITMLGQLSTLTLQDVELAGHRYEEGQALAQQSVKVNKIQPSIGKRPHEPHKDGAIIDKSQGVLIQKKVFQVILVLLIYSCNPRLTWAIV